jgi:DNA-directed RNA polymerase beta' subunit
MTRKLTSEEIENILDFIKPNRAIPARSAISICEKNKERFRVQLREVEVKPVIIPVLKKEIESMYFKSQIKPGEAVGVICAQSIGEKNTQTALNTFHKAGQSEKTMTEGVPRFQELLNATRNQKMVNHNIYLEDATSDLTRTRGLVGNKINHIQLKDIITSMTSHPSPLNEKWYRAWCVMYPPNFDIKETGCVTIMLNVNKMFEYKISWVDVRRSIEDEYDDLYCIASPMNGDRIDIYVDPTHVLSKVEKKVAFVTPENAMEIYLEDVVETNIGSVTVSGIQGIEEIFYTKDGDGTWMVETNSENSDARRLNTLRLIMSIDEVDATKTTSNNIWDIYETLGVEAVKAFLVQEFMSIMDGINECHARLLVDRMTFGGSVSSISRYTMKKDESGPMGKASFEESLDNFLNAAIQGEVEPTKGISASIICGKRSNVGTGIMGLKIKL